MISSSLGSLFGASSSNDLNNTRVPVGQSQQLQSLTGLSENGVHTFVSHYASKNNMSTEESANELIHQIQNGKGPTDPKLIDIFNDAKQTGVPDFAEEMLKGGLLPQQDAKALLQCLGVSSSHANMLMDSVFGDKADAKSNPNSFNFGSDVSAMEF